MRSARYGLRFLTQTFVLTGSINNVIEMNFYL